MEKEEEWAYLRVLETREVGSVFTLSRAVWGLLCLSKVNKYWSNLFKFRVPMEAREDAKGETVVTVPPKDPQILL